MIEIMVRMMEQAAILLVLLDKNGGGPKSAARDNRFVRDTPSQLCDEGEGSVSLVLSRGTGVGIFAEGVWVAVGEDFHQPAIKVIHRMVHDGFKTPVILSVGFFNVITQSDADVLIFAA